MSRTAGRFLQALHQIKCSGETNSEARQLSCGEKLADNVRAIFRSGPTYLNNRMFGAVGFMVGQNMAVGVTGTELIVRTEPDNFEAALALPYARSMDFTSSPMKGFVNIKSTGLKTDTTLAVQVERSAGFARSLLSSSLLCPRHCAPVSGCYTSPTPMVVLFSICVLLRGSYGFRRNDVLN